MLFETRIENFQGLKGYTNKLWVSGLSEFEIQTEKIDWWQSWLFLTFTADPENGFDDYKTVLGCLPLSHKMVKEFIRWYANSTSGRLFKSGKPTVRIAKAWAERFLGGLKSLLVQRSLKQTEKKYIVWVLTRLTISVILTLFDTVDQKYLN
jgi:hypothetical protein